MIQTKSSIIFFILLAIIAVMGILHFQPTTAYAPKESAYERVMRTRTLHCGYGAWPLTEEIDPNTKQVKGLVPDIIKALGQKLGLKIEWTKEIIWGQQLEALKAGKIDAVCGPDGPWNYTSAAVMDFTEPLMYFPVYLYGRKGERHLDNLETANAPDYIFSSYEYDISLSMAIDRFPKARRLELSGAADPTLLELNVATRKTHFVISDPLTISEFNKHNENQLEKVYDQPVAFMNNSFSVGKGETDLLHMLNQGIQLLQQLGISDQILDKYDPAHTLFLRPAKRWELAGGTSESR